MLLTQDRYEDYNLIFAILKTLASSCNEGQKIFNSVYYLIDVANTLLKIYIFISNIYFYIALFHSIELEKFLFSFIYIYIYIYIY
jgi:hypothetical protein